jgi:arylsulfatase A-like enzyme
MLSRRDLIKAAPLGALGIASPGAKRLMAAVESSSPVDKPNILLIISDGHREGLTKRSGYPLDTSPALDQLAQSGVAFDRAYATAPVCAPSRTSFITGRWPQAHRVRQNSQTQAAYFAKDIFDVVKSKGYRTGLIGKNHTYLQPAKLNVWRQYDHICGWKPENPPQEIIDFENWMGRLDFGDSHVPTPFPLETQFPYRIVSDAIEFMRESGDQPFALEMSFPEPHDPEQLPKRYWDMYPPAEVPEQGAGPDALKDKGFKWRWLQGLQEDTYPDAENSWRRYKSNYLGMLRLLDDQLARLLTHMREQHLLEKTIIVYVADHGDYLMDYGLMRKGVGMPESLIRIPMVWSGCGIQGGQPHHPAFVSIADVMPTICEAIGAEIPQGVQGRSLWPLLQGKDYPLEEFRSMYAEVGFGGLYYDRADHVPFSIAQFRGLGPCAVRDADEVFDELNQVTQSGSMAMVRMGDWALFYDMMGYGQLYNLQSDPMELNNLFGTPAVAAKQAQLVQELLAWTIRTQDSLPAGIYETKWATREHNWYAPYRHGTAPEAFIP